jgi:hypothetical protein
MFEKLRKPKDEPEIVEYNPDEDATSGRFRIDITIKGREVHDYVAYYSIFDIQKDGGKYPVTTGYSYGQTAEHANKRAERSAMIWIKDYLVRSQPLQKRTLFTDGE